MAAKAFLRLRPRLPRLLRSPAPPPEFGRVARKVAKGSRLWTPSLPQRVGRTVGRLDYDFYDSIDCSLFSAFLCYAIFLSRPQTYLLTRLGHKTIRLQNGVPASFLSASFSSNLFSGQTMGWEKIHGLLGQKRILSRHLHNNDSGVEPATLAFSPGVRIWTCKGHSIWKRGPSAIPPFADDTAYLT